MELIVQKQPDSSTFSAHPPRAPSPPSSSASSASEPDTEPDAHWDSGEHALPPLPHYQLVAETPHPYQLLPAEYGVRPGERPSVDGYVSLPLRPPARSTSPHRLKDGVYEYHAVRDTRADSPPYTLLQETDPDGDVPSAKLDRPSSEPQTYESPDSKDKPDDALPRSERAEDVPCAYNLLSTNDCKKRLYSSLPGNGHAKISFKIPPDTSGAIGHAFELLTELPDAGAYDSIADKDVPEAAHPYDLVPDKGRPDYPPPAYKMLPDRERQDGRPFNKPRLSLTDVRASWREFSGKFSEHRKKRDKD